MLVKLDRDRAAVLFNGMFLINHLAWRVFFFYVFALQICSS